MLLRRPALLFAAGLLAACGSAPTAPLAAPSSRSTAPLGPSPTAAPSPACTPAPLARRAASVLVMGLPGVTTGEEALAREVVDLGVGGVFVSKPNVRSGAQLSALVTTLRDRAGRPLLVTVDEESGRVSAAERVVGRGSSPRTLARTSTPAQVRAFAEQRGRGLAAVGIDVDFAPSADLDDGPSRGIIGDRSFSADPQRAAEYSLAFAAGLQDAGVDPVVKHFPGHGRSRTDTHFGGEQVDVGVQELRTTDLVPFQRAVDAGVPVVMLNHLQYAALDPDLPASLSPKAYALLRSTGFRGVAITDAVGMGAVHTRFDFDVSVVRAVAAGADAVLAKQGDQAVRMRDALVQAVRSGRLSEARLDEAAARVAALAGRDPVALTCRAASRTTLRLPSGAAS